MSYTKYIETPRYNFTTFSHQDSKLKSFWELTKVSNASFSSVLSATSFAGNEPSVNQLPKHWYS